MSVKVTTWVWEHSRSRGPARLVLLAIADNAHDDGAQAWPSMATLIRKTGLAERTIQGAIKRLVELGELDVRHNAGARHCNLYQVLMGTPAPDAPPHQMHPAGDAGGQEMHPTPAPDAPPPPQEMHPEPSVEPSENRQEKHHVGTQAADSAPEATPDNVVNLTETAAERDARRLCLLLADRIQAWSGHRPPGPLAKRWLTAARLLITRDDLTVQQVEYLITWATDNEFWRPNILSMPKLREKRLTLIGQIQREQATGNGRAPVLDHAARRLAEALAREQGR